MMHEMMLSMDSEEPIPRELTFKLIPQPEEFTLSIVCRNVIGTVFFDTTGQQSINITEVAAYLINVPAGASRIYFDINQIDGLSDSSLQTPSNSVITHVLSWGVVGNISVRMTGCAVLISVPEETPSWTKWGSMFSHCSQFNDPVVSMWDTRNVTMLNTMFSGCTQFNQPLNNWSVGNVTIMNNMFNDCSNFNQPLNNWNVGNILTMNGMFWNAVSFNQNLSNLTFPKVTVPNRFRFDDNTPAWLTPNKPNFTIKA